MKAKAKKKAEPKSAKELSKMDQLRLLVEKCNSTLKAGVVKVGSSAVEDLKIKRTPTGLVSFDYVLGGGLPHGRLTELYGEEGAGKTLLALESVAAVQRRGGTAVWVVGEEFDEAWAVKRGVDLDKLVRVAVDSGDTALETAMELVDTGLVDIVVMDSYQSLGTEREMNDGIDSENYAGAGAPQMWGRVMRRAMASANSGRAAHTVFIGISQVRAAIGKFSPNGAPDPEPSGIRALRHWKAVSVQCKKGEIVFQDQRGDRRAVISREVRMRCKKNKTAPAEERTGYFTLYAMEHEGIQPGIDKVDDVFRVARALDLINGVSWLDGYGIRAQGGGAYLATLRKRPNTVTELTTDTLDAIERMNE